MFRASLVLSILAASAHAEGVVRQCDDASFTVSAPDAEVAAQACGGVDLAQATLGACGFAVSRPVRLEVKPELSTPDCVGIYHCGEDRIEVLTPAALDASIGDGPFTDLDRSAYWRSVIVHEIAHAVYDKVECPYSSCIGTSEYFAYTIQLRSLPRAEQEIFEAATGIDGKVSRDRLSAIIVLMAPDRFAGLAWTHLSQRPDACEYLRLIHDGAINFDFESP